MKKIISGVEAANILNVTRQRIAALCKAGVIRSTQIGNRRYPHADSVEAYKQKLQERLSRAPKTGRNIPTYLQKKNT